MNTGVRGLPFTRSPAPVISQARVSGMHSKPSKRHGAVRALRWSTRSSSETTSRSGSLVRLFQPGASQWIELGSYVFSARADRWQSRAIADFRRWLRAEMSQTEQPSRAAIEPAMQTHEAQFMHSHPQRSR